MLLLEVPFRSRIRSKADIPAIRNWLRTLNTEDYDEYGDPLSADKWPESLRVLNPGEIYIQGGKDGSPQIRVGWGGGFFHWGMTIGMEDMEIPAVKLYDRYESWLLVQPGVYVYDW